MIFSIRKSRMMAAAAGMVLLGGGCVMQKPTAPDRVNTTPIVVDPAMAARNWPQVAAVYPCFSSETGPADVLFVPKESLSPYKHAAAETPIFVADVILLPFGLMERLLAPPWSQVESTSFYIAPTYTANPPLEPKGRNDYSGGTGVGWTVTPGRTVSHLPDEPESADSTDSAPVQ
jgi:hypothetical protein